jgi:Cof subfamily protein (haloacid dehalogenase superfamily)
MTIELVVCDLDGTLIGPELSPSARLRCAIHRAQARGTTVTLATGRGYPSTSRFARELGIAAPLICYQGAQIRDQDGTLLHQATLPREHLPPVIDLSRDGGWELTVYHDDRIYQTTRIYDQAYYDRWFGLPIHRVDDLMATLPGDPTKFIAIAPTSERADHVERQLRHLSNGSFQVMRSHAWFVEGLGANVSKGSAVARLARHLGIARERVMAIGDSGNDESMIEWAELGVAMGNASPGVKDVAHVIAPTLDEDGAAWAIERYALENAI